MRNPGLKAFCLFLVLVLVGLIWVARSMERANAPLPTESREITGPEETTSFREETIETTLPATTVQEPEDSQFVPVSVYLPGVQVELKYATADNFTGQVIYSFSDAYLRYGTVKKLLLVQERLQEQGLSIKIWDAFRPTEAQFTLWAVCPDPTYVADPNQGFSSHSRGNTVDITLVDANGQELQMPTGFDDFSALADRDYSDCPPEAAANARLLEQVMTEAGFRGYVGEWWHFTDLTDYDVETEFVPK